LELDFQNCTELILFQQVAFQGDAMLVGIKLAPNQQDRIIYLRDISAEVNLQEKFNSEKSEKQKVLAKAKLDGLTGCFNRAGFDTKLKIAFQNAIGIQAPMSVMMIDLDFFKNINDQFGHSAGDKYLVEMTRVMQSCLRDCDSLGRMGVDEFSVLLVGCDKVQSTYVGLRILEAVQNLKVSWDHKKLQTTCSVGLCQLDASIQNTEELLKLADACAYISKNSGRNALCVYPDKTIYHRD
jgi:diguanylate cyclase (GGDEF)-like protein